MDGYSGEARSSQFITIQLLSSTYRLKWSCALHKRLLKTKAYLNPVEDLQWSILQKSVIVDVRVGSRYAYGR